MIINFSTLFFYRRPGADSHHTFKITFSNLARLPGPCINTNVFYPAEVVDFIIVRQPVRAVCARLKFYTGKIRAFIAEAHISFIYFDALPPVKTAFTARKAAWAGGLAKSLLLQVIFHRQVAGAHSAVHTARSNQLFFHFQSSPHVQDRLNILISLSIVNKHGRRQELVKLSS